MADGFIKDKVIQLKHFIKVMFGCEKGHLNG